MDFRQDFYDSRAISATHHSHNIRISRQFAQIIQRSRRYSTVIPFNHFQFVSQHPACRIDFIDRNECAIANSLGRSAFGDTKLGVDGDLDISLCRSSRNRGDIPFKKDDQTQVQNRFYQLCHKISIGKEFSPHYLNQHD